MTHAKTTPRRVAVIPGDGVGPEVIREGRAVLARALELAGSEVEWADFAWGSDYYYRTGRMMPEDALEVLAAYDAIYFGAVGDPGVPDHLTVWGLILPIRQAFDQYVNYRPIRWFRGIPARLAGKRPEDVDMVFIRENTEGEYAGVGGRLFVGSTREMAVQSGVFTRAGIERVVRYAFERARERRGELASVTKSNALQHSMVLWDEVSEQVGADYPDVRLRRLHVDAAAYQMVIKPESFDVLVGSNLFGDILTDLGAALQGSLGLAASANLNPAGDKPSLFEPVHGSAPDIAGKGVANPAGAIWSGALMLDHLGEHSASRAVMRALERTFASGVLTPDLGGPAGTREFGQTILHQLELVWQEEAGV